MVVEDLLTFLVFVCWNKNIIRWKVLSTFRVLLNTYIRWILLLRLNIIYNIFMIVCTFIMFHYTKVMNTYCLLCVIIRGRGHGCVSSQSLSITWSYYELELLPKHQPLLELMRPRLCKPSVEQSTTATTTAIVTTTTTTTGNEN